MDAQETAGYSEPCSLCSDVNWGISEEGRFYCLSCHTAVERSRDVEVLLHDRTSSRMTRIGKGPRTKRDDGGHSWRVCEAFQFILKNQADALLELGVSPGFKDLVLCRMWRVYLQRSRQAFTKHPGRVRQGGLDSDSDLDSMVGSSIRSGFSESNLTSDAPSQPDSSCNWSGSVDSASYCKVSRKSGLITMRRTLALLHLALVWSRQALTLSDLLRLVQEGQVPYVKAYEQLPDRMRLMGKDVLLFRVESVPSYRAVHGDAEALALFLQLPAFPPISSETLLHPTRLSLRYLADANLPDELHPWVCRLAEQAGLAGPTAFTFVPASSPALPRYDLQAAALLLVAMKLLFGLDDRAEWDLSNKVQDGPEDTFHLRRWFRLVQTALIRGWQSTDRDTARTQWRSKKMLFRRQKERYWGVKKKRTAEQVQVCFERLSSCPAGVQTTDPSSFRFCWGHEDGADGPSMQHMKLDWYWTLKDRIPTPSHCWYWHPALRPCAARQCKPDHFLPELESLLPQTFSWTLQLFSFLLHVKPGLVLQEALSLERRLLGCKTPSFQDLELTGTGSAPGTRA
ncbi:unnamed protein product [Ophioblennius macclurei]